MILNAQNILICLRYGIGDLVMELPAIERLRETVPRATITALGAEPAVEILDSDDRVDKVVSIQSWGIQHLGDPVGEPVRLQFAHWLASNRFDLILDPSHAASVVEDTVYESGIAIGDSDANSLEAGLTQGMDGLSAITNAVRLGWGLDVPAWLHPVVRLDDEEIHWAREFLEAKGIGGNIAGMSLGASHELKRWPVAHFGRVCRCLGEAMKARILLFVGPYETDLLDQMTTRSDDFVGVEIVSNVHLRRVAALLSYCRMYIGNDSGLMHLAAAVQTPVLVLFGPTAPHLYLPRWVRSSAVVSGVECPYRPEHSFGHPPCVQAGACLIGEPCINAIDPQRVLAVLEQEFPEAREG